MKRSKVVFAIILLALITVFFGSTVIASNSEQVVEFASPILVVNTSFLNIRTGPGAQYTVLITVVGGTELPVLSVASDLVWYQVSTTSGVGWANSEFTIFRGDFTNVPVIRLSDIEAVQATPVQSNVIFVTATPGPGAQAAVQQQSVVGSSCPRSTATLTVASTDLRAQPGRGQQVLAVLFSQGGDVDYDVVGQASVDGIQFIQIIVPGVATGWVENTAFRVHPSGSIGLTVAVLVDVVYVTAPPYSSTNALVLNPGVEAFIVGSSVNGTLLDLELIDGLRIQVEARRVRIRTELTSDRIADRTNCTTTGVAQTSAQTAPQIVVVTGGPTPVGVFAVAQPATLAGSRIVVNTPFLNVRSGPGGQYSIVATLNGGNEYAVIGLTPDVEWYLITGTFGQGWVDSEFVLFRGTGETVPIIRYEDAVGQFTRPVAVIATAITLYAAPGTNFGTIGTLPGPTEAPIVARTADFTWVQVSTPLGFGWVLASQITIRGDTSLIPIVS